MLTATSPRGGVCPVCKGKKKVKDSDGKPKACIACRGTGEGSRYQTK